MSLAVDLHGQRIGTLNRQTATDYTFEYLPGLVAAAGEGAIVLSNSLPVQEEPFDPPATRTYFEGLLPEGSRREEIARELRVSPNDSYALLAEIGRDCAGAIVIEPESGGESDGESRSGEVEWLSDAQVEELIEELPHRPLGVLRADGRRRLSLAGVQRKLTLVAATDGRLGMPTAGAPSTLLLKPQYGGGDFPGLAANEMFCMSVAREIGLPAAETRLLTLAGRDCLVSVRFDRHSGAGGTIRLHQEDLCQALGIPTNLKYERDSGPGFHHFRRLLGDIGRGADVRTMIRAAVLNHVLGNSDAHGKNFAILFSAGGRRLAPLYDLVSTEVYDLDHEMAMAVGSNFAADTVGIADWLDMSADCDLAANPFFKLVREAALQTRAGAEAVAARARAEGWHAPVLDEIVALATRRGSLVSSQLDPR